MTEVRGKSQATEPIAPPCAATRVLMLSRLFRPHFGGAAVQAEGLSHELIRLGCSVFVIAARLGRLGRTENLDGLMIIRTWESRSQNPALQALSFALSSALAIFRYRRRYDLLHLHGSSPFAFIPMAVAKMLHKAVILKMTLTGADDATTISHPRVGLLRRLNFSLPDKVISISRPMSDRYRESGLDEARLVEMPQGVDLARFRPATAEEKEDLRERLGLPRHAEVLLFVGDFSYRKGADILIEAFEELTKSRRQVHLVVVGRDYHSGRDASPNLYEFSAKLQERLRLHNLHARVHFTGIVWNVQDYMRAADVMAFPSRREGLPNVVHEAMASGLPIVTGAIDGLAGTMLDSGTHGFIIDTADPSLYARRISQVLDDVDLATRMGRAAQHRAEERYSFVRVAKEYRALYEALTGSVGARDELAQRSD